WRACMCKVIILASSEPLPESARLSLYPFTDPTQLTRNPNAEPIADNSEFMSLRAALPEANYFYGLGGCQCYFRYYSEEEIAETYASHLARGDQQMAESTRTYLGGVRAEVANTADYLDENLEQTRIWMISKWEGDPLTPDCLQWTLSPSYFRQPDF